MRILTRAAIVAILASLTFAVGVPTQARPRVHDGWESGASGEGVADGSFARWRHRPVTIVGTWNDSKDAQENEYTLIPGGEYAGWTHDVDVAIGAIYEDQGETWASAAAGAYDVRWSQALRVLAANRANRGTTYIRFAHEMNGDWEPWRVSSVDVHAFRQAWHRFRRLQLQIFPQARLVFCPSVQSSSSLNLDWRRTFPGRRWVDVMGVDAYNQYPYANSKAAFSKTIRRVDQFGAPAGIEQYRLFAQRHRVPLAIPEWSTNALDGDGIVYMKQFHRWLASNAGVGPGQIVYEIIFNVHFQENQFQLYPLTLMPRAAQYYRRHW